MTTVKQAIIQTMEQNADAATAALDAFHEVADLHARTFAGFDRLNTDFDSLFNVEREKEHA